MRTFKVSLDLKQKQNLYARLSEEINTNSIKDTEIAEYIINLVLNISMPEIASTIINKLKKEMLSYV